MTKTFNDITDEITDLPHGKQDPALLLHVGQTSLEAALRAAIARRPTADAEFCRMTDLRPLFGISRSKGYELERDGHIQTVSLRPKGTLKGTKLVLVESVRRFLRGLLDSETNQ